MTATGEKRRRRLRLEEAEAFRELGRDQVAEANVVDEDDEADPAERLLARRSHRHVAGDHGDLGFEIDAIGLVRKRDRIARAEEAVGAALVHERIGPEACRHLRAARFSHELDMVHIGRAVRPLIGPGQGRGAIVLMEAEGGHAAMFELLRQGLQLRSEPLPIVQSRLKVGTMKNASVARVRSFDTMTSRPSRPCFNDASFIS